MKTSWTRAELQSNRGCYEREQVDNLIGKKESVSLIEIMDWTIPITDKRWFLFNKAEMTLDQKKQFALICAKVVLPIYEEKYPEDRRVRDCIEGTEKFYRGEISRDDLWKLRAYAAYAAADADAADAAAAAAAADAAADADAAYAAAAAAAADAARKTTYSQRLKEAFIEFVNSQTVEVVNQ